MFLKLYSDRLGIKRIGWERKSLLELSFNLVGDSRKEHTDKILAHLDFFHTVKYWKKISANVTLKIFLMHLIVIKYSISLHVLPANIMVLCPEQPLYFVHVFSIWQTSTL